MQCLLQRVKRAAVRVNDRTIATIGSGLLVFIGVDASDDLASVHQCVHKLLHYRIFPDERGRMNRHVMAVSGEVLLVSQFTLSAATGRGLRPSFSQAALPEQAQRLYQAVVEHTQAQYPATQSGQFAADMDVELVNDGPVTFLLQC